MRNIIMLSILFLASIAYTQEAIVVQSAYQNIEIEEVLSHNHNADNMHELLEVVTWLPLKVSAGEKGFEEWLAERKKNVEIYLKWYQNMFAVGFKLDQRAIIGVDAERAHQKNKSVKSFLIAEQRIRRFVKNNYKGLEKSNFRNELLSFGETYAITSYKIMRKALNPELSFVVYDKSLKVN